MRAKYALLIHAVLGFSLLYSARADDIITFPDLPDWQLRPDIQKFTAENLYAYINGAAPLYHSYQFTELTVGEYENAADKTILIEMYRHIDPVNAFGIFSQEKPDEGVFLAIGIQAYLSPPMLNLCVDNYYIKIICDDLGVETNTTLQFVGRKIAEQSAGRYDLPHYFQFFPDSGRVPYSEQYHSKAFLGHEFLNSIFTVKYAYDDQEFTLFIYAGTSDFHEQNRPVFLFHRCCR